MCEDRQPIQWIVWSNDCKDANRTWEKNEWTVRILKNQTELKNRKSGKKKGINSRLDDTEEWLSELEDRVMEIKFNNNKKCLKMRTGERSLWYNIKCTNIHIIGIPGGEERKGQRTDLMM